MKPNLGDNPHSEVVDFHSAVNYHKQFWGISSVCYDRLLGDV